MKWRSRTARPFLRDLFPGYDVYLWLDADTFVQASRGLEWLVDAASRGSVAVVPAVDRSYFHNPRQMGWLAQRYRWAFGEEIAKQLMQHAYVNAGVFAFDAVSPVWEHWARRFQEALDRWEGNMLSDQAMLNGVLLLDRVPLMRLPSLCNWICHLALPRWHEGRRQFFEASYPYNSIFIVHNTLVEKTRFVPIRNEHGRKREMRICFNPV